MKKWLKLTLTLIIMIGLTAALYFAGFKSDWIQPIVDKAGVWGYFVYLIIQIVVTTLLCFVPATTFTFTLLSVQIFGVMGGLFISIIGCWISSIIMFLIGKYGGVKLVDWIVGKEDRIKAQNLVSARATVLIPVMLACPFFPDDAICMISGLTSMNIWYFSIMALLTRSIGIATTALLGNGYTLNYIQNALGNNIVLWILAINVLLFDVILVWKGSGKIEQIIKRVKSKKQAKFEAKQKLEEEQEQQVLALEAEQANNKKKKSRIKSRLK